MCTHSVSEALRRNRNLRRVSRIKRTFKSRRGTASDLFAVAVQGSIVGCGRKADGRSAVRSPPFLLFLRWLAHC